MSGRGQATHECIAKSLFLKEKKMCVMGWLQASQRGRIRGVVFEHDDLNITVIAKNWADIITDARSKLNFINQQLAYDATSESAISYLHKTHSKFIPKVESLYNEEDTTDE